MEVDQEAANKICRDPPTGMLWLGVKVIVKLDVESVVDGLTFIATTK